MVINNTKEFKEVCKTILMAIDNSEQSLISETLEVVADGGELSLAVTNREYYVQVKMEVSENEHFRATVNALLFLRLVSQLSSSDLQLVINDNYLLIKADGNYKLPLIFKDENLLELPRIELNNITTVMDIQSNILNSILLYNTKELQSAKIVYKPVQKMYYMDNNGAITFTTGACVNNFELDKPIKVLLSQKVVKLFKLFGDDVKVKFNLSQEPTEDGSVSTRVKFATDTIEITAITPSDTQLIESVPVSAIRSMADKAYDYSALFDKDRLSRALSRLYLFKNEDPSVALQMTFNAEGCNLRYCDNEEFVGYQDEQPNDLNYSLFINIETLKNIIDGCVEDYLTLSFGDSKAVVLSRQAIKNIIPELVMR